MRHAHFFAIGGLAATCFASINPATTCDILKHLYSNITLLPDDLQYTAENEFSWNAGAWLGPACIIVPTCAGEVSQVIKALVEFNTPFAIRGGGHMTIPNAANINSSGVLISGTNLNMLQLSADQGTLSVGTGNIWSDVYQYLNASQSGKMVVGARDAVVGVPGFLLGGGVSFFGYEYGFGSTNGNVRTFECVLSDGQIIEATASNEHSDLYWALQGGGNSFCILTRVDLRTIDSPGIMLANPIYGSGTEIKDQWLESILNYATQASSDPKAAIIPVVSYGGPYTEPVYNSLLFYNGNNSSPEVLKDFQGGLLPQSNSTDLVPMTMAEYAELQAPAFQKGGQSYGFQQRFYVVSIPATMEAMTIVHDTYFDTAASYKLSNLTGLFASLGYTAITTRFIEASNSGIGCPQGVEDIPLLWVEESLSWSDAADDTMIENFLEAVNANITAQLKAIDAIANYLYLNDADQNQPVFQGYPAENLQRLKEIRARYDPGMIYTNLMPGGFKVAHA